MQTTLKVNGMHCNSCKMLIQMSLEEAGLEEKIHSVENTQNNQGQVVLRDVNETDVKKAKEIINSINPNQYKVVEND